MGFTGEVHHAQIDLGRRVAWAHCDQVKVRKAIAVSLNKEAMTVLCGQRGKHKTYVFSYVRKGPVTQVNTKVWKQALKREVVAADDLRMISSFYYPAI